MLPREFTRNRRIRTSQSLPVIKGSLAFEHLRSTFFNRLIQEFVRDIHFPIHHTDGLFHNNDSVYWKLMNLSKRPS